MRINAKRLNIMFLCLIMATVLFCSSASAHDMWVEVRNYTPETGQDITMTVGYDHYLPAREFLPKEYLDEIYMLDPNGKRLGVERYSDVEFKANKAPKQEGTFLVVATQKGRFWTKTTEGYQSGHSKKGLQDVISCTYSAKYGKAIVNIGAGGGKAVFEALGHELEIIPLKDPGKLRVGDDLPIKIVFKGKPIPYSSALATYVGFSREKNVFAYATKTDKNGMAKIKMLTAGAWLVTAHHEDVYPNPEECDKYSFAASLTFEIK
jgi:uncharacterized GH25 family protein